jgi:asparagine synthase (glutamine-hydrolysing)
LSGGIDSSLVAAIAARQTPGIEAFTVGMSGAGYDETPYARAVAARYGMVHRVVPLDDEAIVAAFDSVTAKLDEPLADSSLLPSWVLCRAARQRVTVALSGDGADELFAGYANFAPNRFAKVLRHVSPTLGVWLRRALRIVPAGSGYMDLAFKLRQLSHGFGVPPPTQWSAWMSPFAHEDLRRLWRGPDLQADSFSALVKDSADEHWSTASLLEAFTTTYLPEDILAKVDRASMYNSLEVRAPYLDRAFAEAAMALPVGAKFRGLTGKRVLKKLAERFLPSDLIDRPKHGFAAPVADMLRGPLGASVRTTLFEGGTRLAAWFDRATIMRMWEEHAMRRVDHRKPIWTLFVLFRVVDRLGARI